MKITGKNPLLEAQLKLKESRGAKKTTGQSNAAGPKGVKVSDRVDVSGKAKRLASLRKLVEASPDVREEKVERIKRDIDDGKYNMKSAKIAEGIIKKAISFYNNSNHID